MKTVTFPQKMSGTGTIHDTSSEHGDRVVRFRKGELYAVVKAAYYGGKGYRTAQTAEQAMRLSKGWAADYSHIIIDSDGNLVTWNDLYDSMGH